MSGVLMCAILAVGADPAPPPRPVQPDISLLLSDTVSRRGEGIRDRIVRIGFRNGKPLPPEVLYERKWSEEAEATLESGDVRDGRYFVAESGSVLDLREKKLINAERYSVAVHTDDTKVTYWIKDAKGTGELFTFEYATKKRTRIERLASVPLGVPFSPDGKTAIDRVKDEFTVQCAGQKPNALGAGLQMGPSSYRWTGTEAKDRYDVVDAVFWLDNSRILAHRKAGEIVTVTLDGKMSEVVTISGVPEDAFTELSRDPGGGFVYSFCSKDKWPLDEKRFKIDVAKKTATPTEWIDLGHGFEAAHEPDEKWQIRFRHNGKDIGHAASVPQHRHQAVASPGYLAVPVPDFEKGICTPRLALWSAATRQWTFHECRWTGVLAWIK